MGTTTAKLQWHRSVLTPDHGRVCFVNGYMIDEANFGPGHVWYTVRRRDATGADDFEYAKTLDEALALVGER